MGIFHFTRLAVFIFFLRRKIDEKNVKGVEDTLTNLLSNITDKHALFFYLSSFFFSLPLSVFAIYIFMNDYRKKQTLRRKTPRKVWIFSPVSIDESSNGGECAEWLLFPVFCLVFRLHDRHFTSTGAQPSCLTHSPSLTSPFHLSTCLSCYGLCTCSWWPVLSVHPLPASA